ncbi:Inosine-uridine nucleoside N-ribohydrolase [Modicisalibacter ilicicola DSM 19980]|uniref:Inosine-uridine nucleoside N-ribohydrolase n=1 Tax=Modicisalibacter ilicicola DSM 19980 TaxID=1121942 RepID=A0A1M4UDJ8_9GAMM|nr:nucleoside hydrolase [Halomonas ilicicola]SHE54852.1 Inosine-uridine nucleoside N-ribohydrolase [Halomonas ilicicola DSM 19980]
MSKTGKVFIRLAVAAAAVPVLFAVSLALPIPAWRTGRLPVPPLPVVENGPRIKAPDRVWVDTDAACGVERRADPDDCFALMLLARAPDIEIVGVSTVFGNAKLEMTDRTTRRLASKLREAGTRLPAVHRGAGAPSASSTPAQDALRRALADRPLTLVALGPLTNIAAALEGRPDLQANVVRIVAVMGRRPGHIFHPSEGNGEGMLFGHGPIFRDLNFDKDRKAATRVLSMGLPLSLIPYDVAREVSLKRFDLDQIARSGMAGAWIASRAQGWLEFWKEEIGRDGFHPFDLLAAAYVLDPYLFNCAAANAWVGKDEHLSNVWFYDPVALQVGGTKKHPADPLAETEAIYCVTANAALRDRLMDGLAGMDRQASTD